VTVEILNLRVRTFALEGEAEKVAEAFERFLPAKTEVLVEDLDPETDGGVFTHPLKSVTAKITQPKVCKDFLMKAFSSLTDSEKSKVVRELPHRVDDKCNFYLRFSKADFIDGRLKISELDAVQFKVKVAAYPAKKEIAVKVLKEFLESENEVS